MTEDDIKALIKATLVDEVENLLKPTVDNMTKELERFVNDTNEKFRVTADQLGEIQPQPAKVTKKTDVNDDRIKALEQKLADAEARREAQEKQAQQLRFDNSLSAELDKIPNLLQKSVVKELLSNRLKADIKEAEDGFYSKGKKIPEVVQEFMKSDTGLHFQASDHKDGAGSTEPSSVKASSSNEDYLAGLRAFAETPQVSF